VRKAVSGFYINKVYLTVRQVLEIAFASPHNRVKGYRGLMKRITIIAALLVAALAPAVSHAQALPPQPGPYRDGYVADRPIQRASSAILGGLDYMPSYVPSSNSSARSGRTLADDLDAGVDFSASNNPILACSGLDIRDSIKGMFDMSSLADDVKNYLTSLMAKQALSLVYANPAIAGVLDGLKAFGNARFQLAQQSCEAIEGEISAQSRFLRQQALDKCIKDGGSVYECSVETGNYANALNEFVNSAEAKLNNSIYSFTSRINILEPDTKAAMCAQLSRHEPAACAKAQQVNAAIAEPVLDKAGNVRGTNPPVVSARRLNDSNYRNSLGSAAVYTGVMMSVAEVFGGDMFAADAALAQIAEKRKRAYAEAMSRRGGKLMAEDVTAIFDRSGGERAFVGSAREMTVRMAGDLESRYPHLQASEYEDINDHGPGNSYHYVGQAIDFNCNSHPDGERACLDAVYADLNARRGELGIVELIWQAPGHYDHLHVAFGSPNQGPGTRSGMTAGILEDATVIVEELAAGIEQVAATATPEARITALEQALKKVPLVTEDACYYELDTKKETGLEDISDVTLIFSANTVANQLVEKSRNRPSEEGEPGAGGSGGGIMGSLTAQVQEMNLTGGRLSLCYFISEIDRLSIMKMQYLNNSDGLAFLKSLAEDTAAQATQTIYDGLINQVNLARIMASNNEAPPAMDTILLVGRETLETQRDSIKANAQSRAAMSGRLRTIDDYLAARNRETRARTATQGGRLGKNLERR